MLITSETNKNCIIFYLSVEEGDYAHSPMKVMNDSFSFEAEKIDFSSLHPDRKALVAIINTLPFAGKRIFIDWDVSSEFLEATRVITRINIEAKSTTSSPNMRYSSGIPALSFSGGADSTAALSVMPNNTEPVFMLRSKKDKIKSISKGGCWRCRRLTELGRLDYQRSGKPGCRGRG